MKKYSEVQDAVAYARYSSHSQKDTSIEDQVADIRIYCKQHGLRLVKIYADRHLSGTSDNRPQFLQMIKDAQRASWKTVVVWKTDRFARNRYDSATYKYKLKKCGVKVVSAKESIPDGPEGILLESILEGSAEYYSANLAQNIKRGMYANAAQCKVNCGNLPYGYCKGPDGRFAVKEPDAEVVREIFGKVAAGVPFVDIANDLNGRGIKTRLGNRWNSRSSFYTMLRNEAYIGVYKYGDVRIEGGMPAIIEPATFWEVDRILKHQKGAQGRHRANGDYLLTGKLRCGHCGEYMVGMSGTSHSGELHYYYICRNHRDAKSCKKKNVPRDWIEKLVVQATLEHVLTDDMIQWITDAVMAYQDSELAAAPITAMRQQREEVRKAIGNLMKAIEAGIINQTVKDRLDELEAEGRRLDRDIELEKAATVVVSREAFLSWITRFKTGNVADKEFQRKVIDSFISVVYLSDDRLRILFNYTGRNETDVSLEDILAAESAAGADCSFSAGDSPPYRGQTNIVKIFFIGHAFILSMELLKERP